MYMWFFFTFSRSRRVGWFRFTTNWFRGGRVSSVEINISVLPNRWISLHGNSRKAGEGAVTFQIALAGGVTVMGSLFACLVAPLTLGVE